MTINSIPRRFSYSRISFFKSLLCLVLLEQAVCAAGLTLPFKERFSEGCIAPEWAVDVSEGNTIAIRDGALEIRAGEHTYAHLQRPLDIDCVRATFSVQPDGSASWMPSLFIYWDSTNWCQIGWRGLPFVVEMLDGKLVESMVSATGDKSAEWHYNTQTTDMENRPPAETEASWRCLGIELGKKTVRFLHSADGRDWQTLRVIERTGTTMTGKPKLLILGKGFTNPPQYPASDMNNDYPQQGKPVVSRIKDLVVTATATDRMGDVESDVSPSRDVVGEQILAEAKEPSYEAVAGIYPEMKYPREMVGVKDHPHDFVVLPDGAIHYGSGYLYFEVGDPPARFGMQGEGLHKRLHAGSLPMVIADYECGGLRYEQTVFGYSQDFSPDKPIYAYLRLRVANPTSETRPVRVACRLTSKTGELLDPQQPDRVWNWELPAGASQTLYLKFPYPAARQTLEQPPVAEFDGRFREVEQYWRKLLDQGMTIDVPEERVNQAWRAWLTFNFLDVNKLNGRYEPHDSSLSYPLVYGITSALYCRILDQYGYHEDARRYLDSLLTFVEPDGRCVINYGLPDGGALLVALNEHYQITRDAAWVRQIAPTAERLSDWIIRKRHEAIAAQPKDAAWYGLLYEKPYCDYIGKAYNYVGDVHLAVGLEAAGRMFRDVGMTDAATRFSNEARDYKRDILASMDRSTIIRDGLKIIPMFPETHAALKASNYTAEDYYGLLCGQMLENVLFTPDSWQAMSFVNMLEQRRGLNLGMCRFLGGIDHAYTYGYWHNCLQRGEIGKVLLGFYGSLAYGMSRGTYSGAEVTLMKSGKNFVQLPHLYSGTQQLRLLRNMLVREDDRRLILAQAVPRAWLADGKSLRVRNAATFFGPVGYVIESRVNEGKILVSLDPPATDPPQSIELHLRHPDESKAIRSVTVNGVESKAFTKYAVTLTKFNGPQTIEVRY